MNIIKGKGQRLIPEELLKYLEAFKEAHPDPTAGGESDLASIEDSQGHKRFIEGQLTPSFSETVLQNVVPVVQYTRWSLSGTHLMLVACVYFTNALSNSGIESLFKVELPEWIYNKITPLGESGFVGKTTFTLFASGNIVCNLYKRENNNIEINTGASFPNDKTLRIQFDLLIDSE